MTTSSQTASSSHPKSSRPIPFLSAHTRRVLRENLTAYILIFPATALIFLFGLFPVAFAVFVSLHRWKIKMGNFVGLRNYVNGIDTLAYIVFFGIGLGGLALAVLYLRRTVRVAGEEKERPWVLLLPAVLLAGGALQFVRFLVALTPEFLGIADKIIGLEKTRELFMQLLGEAFRAETVWPEMLRAIGLLLAGAIVAIAIFRWYRSGKSNVYLFWLFVAVLGAAGGAIILNFTYQEIEAVYSAALEEGEPVALWTQIVTITSGIILVALAWFLWQSANRQDNAFQMGLRLLGGTLLLVGGWILVGELPMVIAAGDKDVWQGLKVTAWYSFGTVPIQLAFSLFLAYLLFQNLKGKDFFRIIFFLPYVTPVVASAGIFRVMFSNRPAAPLNQLLGWFGVDPQSWLLEPTGIFEILAEGIGLTLPEWAGGPSMALVVIIIFGVWSFVGFNTVIYLAGLGNIPNELYEVAQIDGAGRWDSFRYVTFPLLSPTTYFLSLLAVIGTFKAFGHIWVLRNPAALGTTDTFSVTIFVELFDKARFGYASALAFVLFGVILTLTMINNRVQGSRVFYG